MASINQHMKADCTATYILKKQKQNQKIQLCSLPKWKWLPPECRVLLSVHFLKRYWQKQPLAHAVTVNNQNAVKMEFAFFWEEAWQIVLCCRLRGNCFPISRKEWDRWLLMGLIGTAVGMLGFLIHQIIDSLIKLKWDLMENYLQVSKRKSEWPLMCLFIRKSTL